MEGVELQVVSGMTHSEALMPNILFSPQDITGSKLRGKTSGLCCSLREGNCNVINRYLLMAVFFLCTQLCT